MSALLAGIVLLGCCSAAAAAPSTSSSAYDGPSALVPCSELPELIGLKGIAPVFGKCSPPAELKLATLSADDSAPGSTPPPAVAPSADEASTDGWIVELDAAHEAALAALCSPAGPLGRLGIECGFTYGHAILGFSTALPRSLLAGFLAAVGLNASAVHADTKVSLAEVETVASTPSQLTADSTSRSGTWGLDRIDQQSFPLDGLYHYYGDGAGVNAYIVDTGIRVTHDEFRHADGTAGSRADAVFTAFSSADDCQGHGTHVASVVGGLTFGVAKDVSLHALRVLDCDGSGSVSAALAALDWVVANGTVPSVVTLSLVGSANAALDAAVTTARQAGFLVAVAAGNTLADACDYSPGRSSGALTVGASDIHDDLLYVAAGKGSNFGSCVDVFAPGDTILGADYVSDQATKYRSGTSQAVPFVAGLGALLIANASAGVTPDELEAKVVALAVPGELGSTVPDVTVAGTGTPNLILQTVPAADDVAAGPSAASSPTVASPAPTPTASSPPPPPPPPPPPSPYAAAASEPSGDTTSDAPDAAPIGSLIETPTDAPIESPSGSPSPAPAPAPGPSSETPAPAPEEGLAPALAPVPAPAPAPVPAPTPSRALAATPPRAPATPVASPPPSAFAGGLGFSWAFSTGPQPPPPPAPVIAGLGTASELTGASLAANPTIETTAPGSAAQVSIGDVPVALPASGRRLLLT